MEWVMLGFLALAWLISPIILLIALVVARRQARELRRQLVTRSVPEPSHKPPPVHSTPSLSGGGRYGPADLENLLLLRLELRRLAEAGTLEGERHRQLSNDLDRLWERHLRKGGVSPDGEAWRLRRTMAWNLLAQGVETPPGPPPWQPATLTPGPAPASGRGEVALEPLALPAAPAESQPPLPPPASIPARRRAPVEAPTPESVWEQAAPAADWRPAAPSPLEKALRALSGWPRLIAPFLAQNIGWFIGGFCFVAGALFLIANTQGFINALTVFASLLSATAFLIWAGYRFRRERPELVVASGMLLTLGMLLAPLDLAVAVRLADASAGNGLLLAVSLLIVAGALAAFAWTAILVSGLMDRALMGRYPWLVTALAAVQLAAPLAAVAPGWPGLAVLHGVLLGVLGYGLWTFAVEWLRRLFVDRWLITYYAAGLLVYTAAVSFVHLTWLWPEPLPAGYAGPFLMALCGLLFTVDAAFKDWVHKYAFLSRFSFALYGLSAAAVAVAVQTPPTAILTLALGAVLYGWVTWRYRTLPPLYLLLGCVAGLYGYVILKSLPLAWHELASLPGLLALLGLCRWANSRSRAIAWQCLIAFGLLLPGLTVWSLVWASPGWLGFATAATAALLAYISVRLALALPEADPRWAWADGAVVLLAMAAASYAPDWLPFGWPLRTAFGLLALAALWTTLGLHDRRQAPISRTVFVVGALVNVVLALVLGGLALWPTLLGRWEPILLLALAGALLLWLSWGLRQQALFYGVLACAGGIGVLIKRGWFPGPSTGLGEFTGVLALWALLWWLDRPLRVRRALLENAEDEESTPPAFTALVHAPLEQAMVLLWLVGLIHLGQRWMGGGMAWSWPWSAGVATLTGLLLIGHFQQFRWAALPMLLGLAGLLVGLDRIGWTPPWLGAVAVLYALLVWRLGIVALGRRSVWRAARMLGFTTPGGAGGRQQVQESLRGGALLVAAAAVAASPTLAGLGWPAAELWPALALSLWLFGLASWEDRSTPCTYAALITLTLGVWLTSDWLAPTALFGLDQPMLNVLLSLALAMAAVGLEAKRAAPVAYWRAPLAVTSSVLYGLALAGVVPLGFLPTDVRLPILLALLCVALFPVARPWPNAADWRGLGLPVLLSVLVGSLADWAGYSARENTWLAIAWGYALWGGGNLLLPRWNARWPGWAVDPVLWPLLGLASVLGGGVVGVLAGALSPAALLAALALYLFLLLRNTAWPGMAWLAVAALTASGLLASGALEWSWWGRGQGQAATIRGCVVAVAELNLLFLLVPLWRRHGQWLARGLRWRQADLESPLFWIPFAVLILLLARVLLLEAGGLLWDGAFRLERSAWALTGLALLLAATAGHAFRLRPAPLTAHVLLVALGMTALAAWLDLSAPLVGLPLAVALWDGALLLAWRYGPRHQEVWRSALDGWLSLLPAASLGLLPLVADSHWTVCTATLLVLAAAMLARGWWQGRLFWLNAGLTLALAGSYTVWLTGAAGFAWSPLVGLAPWYAAQTVLLLLASMAVRRRLAAWLDRADLEADSARFGRLGDLEQTVAGLVPWLLALSALWLGLHGGAVAAHLAGWRLSPWHFGIPADPLAAGAALLMLAGLTLTRAWRWPDEPNWVYATALLLGLLAGYGRLLALGLAPFAVVDTVAVMAAGYVAFLLHQFTGSPPLYRLALGLPLLALATAPWQLASVWTGGTLLAAAVLYLSLASALRNPWPLYLGVLALNGAIYLWAPLWAERHGLWQFYIAPAAASVLALLHLHRRELRPNVLNGARLAALSALYAGAGLDVFLRPELSVFVLALGLALLGVVAGVALRIRAFLYAGVAFLVLNVAGQLIRFYPEQALSRALILLGLGTAITVGMVLFSLKREAILRRVRVLRADLAAWE
ncbi:MAG: hypothetical protein P9F75_04505 [Candidatus Contendobacter sp.]|nr:hypothetical protein [Candidatus Contendobacter sp.]